MMMVCPTNRPGVAAFYLLVAAASTAMAQEPLIIPDRPAPRFSLSLADALAQARVNSPSFRSAQNDNQVAAWSVRNAYGALVPTLSVSSGMGYTGSGSSTFGGTNFNQSSPALTSTYAITLNLQVDGSTLTQPGQELANRRAVEEEILRAGVDLRTQITTQYLTALEAIASTDVARQQVARNAEFLALARVRLQVGQATELEVRQAEVQRGQSDLGLLRAIQRENEAKLVLFRLMGLQSPVPIQEVALTDSFPVTEPLWQLDDLQSLAAEANPNIRSLRARESAAGAAVRASKSAYYPSLSLSAGWRGFTQEFTNEQSLINNRLGAALGQADNCRFQNELISALPGGALPGRTNGGLIDDCNGFAGLDATGIRLNSATAQGILQNNNVFPFSFRTQPFQANLTVSLPIFNGFSRELRVAQARAQEEDVRENRRAADLQVRTDVETRWLDVRTNYQAILVQEANRRAALEQLRLAQDRYRVGVGNSLEVTDGQTAVQQAESDYVTAVYSYHRAIAALEAAIGRTLR